MEKKILYTTDLKENGKESPFDLDLINNNGELNKFFQVSLTGELIKELTLKDLVNSQVEELKDIASSGYNAQNASSGNYAQNASSGNYAQNASGGYNAQNASSGDYAKNASSSNYAQNASSGDDAQNASSSNYAQNASSGYDARNASSGDYAKNASSGYNARNASSGNYARNDIKGKFSTCFDCGYHSLIKGIKGTWIALQEYDTNGKPCFAKVGQIGNSRYKDFQNETLKEDYFYELINKQFVPILIIDNCRTVIFSKKIVGNKTIYHAMFESDYYNKKMENKVYVVVIDGVSAHGKTIKEAVADIEFKLMKQRGVEEVIARIKKDNKVYANDYRIITGACLEGTKEFARRKGLEMTDTKTIDEIIELTKGEYGHDTFVRAIKRENK